MEFSMQIEYVRYFENAIADALFSLDFLSIDAEVLALLARVLPSYACSVANAERINSCVN